MELHEVCESLLDNADMSIDLSLFPSIKMDIIVQGLVQGKFWKVVFECGQVVHLDFEFDDDSTSNDMFMILDCSVKETLKKKVTPAVQHRMESLQDDDPAWCISMYGDMSLSLVTTKFKWQLIEQSQTEHEAEYA